MKKIILLTFYTLLFAVFLVVMNYPFVSRLINEKNQGTIALAKQAEVEKMEDDLVRRLQTEAKEYNRQLATGVVEENILLSSHWMNEMIGTIEIPKIDETLSVYLGTSEDILQKGAGVIKGSSLPVGGESTHSCISAHRGLVRKEFFTRLDELKVGDIFILHVLGEKLVYRVNSVEEVLPTNVDSLKISKGEDLVTLITCTPYGINTHRLYVHAQRFHYDELAIQEQIDDKGNNLKEWWWTYLSGLYIALWALCIYRVIRNEDELLKNEVFDDIIGMR